MSTRLRTLLDSNRVVLMDGAMGTELLRAGAPAAEVARWSLTHPEAVLAVHRAYVAAGAEVLLTNTFHVEERNLAKSADQTLSLGTPGERGGGEGASPPCKDVRFREACSPPHPNPLPLSTGGEGANGSTMSAALALARQALPHGVVLADIGPLRSVVAADVQRVLAGCQDADGVLLETWSNVDHLRAFAAIHAQTPFAPPLLVSFTFRRSIDRQLRTFRDFAPEACAVTAMEVGALALGVNCGADIGLAELLDVVRAYRDVTDLPLLVRPNAGSPGAPGHPRSPEEMAEWVPALIRAGVTMIGGCCGTTPAHIAALRQAIDAACPRFI